MIRYVPRRALNRSSNGGSSCLPTRYGSRISGPVMNWYAAIATASGNRSLRARRTVGVVRSSYGSAAGSSVTLPRTDADAWSQPGLRPRPPHHGPTRRRSRPADAASPDHEGSTASPPAAQDPRRTPAPPTDVRGPSPSPAHGGRGPGLRVRTGG